MARRLTEADRRCRDLLERDFQWAYVKALRSIGFLVAHHYDSRFADPGVKGFPDLVIVGYGRMLFHEVKRETGIVSPEQEKWMMAIDEASPISGLCQVIRPSDWYELMSEAERIASQPIDPELREFPTPRKKPKRRKKTAD